MPIDPEVWSRYAAMVSGPALFFAGVAVADPSATIVAIVVGLLYVGGFAGALAASRARARNYKREIDAMHRTQEEENR